MKPAGLSIKRTWDMSVWRSMEIYRAGRMAYSRKANPYKPEGKRLIGNGANPYRESGKGL